MIPSVFFGSPAKLPKHKVVKGLHAEQKTITSRCYGKWPFPEQIWYSCHLGASYVCILNLFSMSRCRLNLESNNHGVQLLCFQRGARVPMPAGCHEAPHQGHIPTTTWPPRASSHQPTHGHRKLCSWVCAEISNLTPKKPQRVEHEFPSSHKRLSAYKDFSHYIHIKPYQKIKNKTEGLFSCPMSL